MNEQTSDNPPLGATNVEVANIVGEAKARLIHPRGTPSDGFDMSWDHARIDMNIIDNFYLLGRIELAMNVPKFLKSREFAERIGEYDRLLLEVDFGPKAHLAKILDIHICDDIIALRAVGVSRIDIDL